MSLSPQSNANPSQNLGFAQDGEIDLWELYAVIKDGRYAILGLTILGLLVGCFVAFVSRPIYQADALIQVEKQGKTSMSAALGDMAEVLGGETPVPAEVEIIKSRTVVGKMIANLGLELSVAPRFAPVIGEAIARRYRAGTPRPALFGLDQYAWGGERIAVASFDIPEVFRGANFIIQAGASGNYALFDTNRTLLTRGVVGEPVKVQTPEGEISLFIQELVARPQTEFYVKKLVVSQLVDSISGQVKVVERGKQSSVLEITFDGPNPKKVTDLVNSLITGYQRQNVERRSAEAEQTLVFLREQLPEIKLKLDEAEAKLNKYRLEQGSADLTQETQIVLQSNVELETKRLELVQKRQEALQKFTGNHPVVQTLNAQLGQIEGGLSRTAGKVKNLPKTQQELLTLSRDVQVNTELYTSLLNSAQELQVAKAGTVGNVRIIDYAVLPLNPIKPKQSLIIGLATLLGLFAGVGAVFVRRAMHQGIDDPSVIEEKLGIPVYATIPFAPDQKKVMKAVAEGAAPRAAAILALRHPQDLAVEALRGLRTSLHFAMLESTNNIVMLTGPSPNLGKSFISMNFAAVVAASGKSVVVVDADLRRGHLHDYVTNARGVGLSDYVAAGASLDSILMASGVVGMSVISTGDLPPNPSELLMHPRFEELLKQLSARFDYVLVDTPPVLAVADAGVIGRLAGCTLLTLKAGTHPLREIAEAHNRLRQAGVAVRGILFNQVGASGRSYRYQYQYGYEYKSQETPV